MTENREELELLEMSAGERVLCVVAHPDDLEYGTSCACARWVNDGVEVAYLLLTAGEAGIQGMPPSETGPLRVAEQRLACAAVGVEDLRILDFRDGVLEQSLQLREAIAAVIREVRPTTVVTMAWDLEMPWGLNQADHRVAGISTLDAIRDAGNPWVFPELVEKSDLEPWTVDQLLVFGSERPTHVVDVAGQPLEQGISSLQAHRDYLAALPDHPEPRALIEDVTREAGQSAGLDVAVSFRRYAM